MSKKRHILDFYETDGRLTQTLIDTVDIKGRVFEPCVGDHAIARFFPRCLTADINPEVKAHLTQDATMLDSWKNLLAAPDWVITNPPFSLANEIVPLAMDAAAVGIAFLLRLSWLEPTKKRADFLQKYNAWFSDLIIFNPRPRFRQDTNSTDSVTVAWMVWRKDFRGTGPNVTFANSWLNRRYYLEE